MQMGDKMVRSTLLSFLLYSNLLAIGGYRTSVVRSENGFIDYANRVIVCRGTADIEEKESGDGSLDVIGSI